MSSAPDSRPVSSDIVGVSDGDAFEPEGRREPSWGRFRQFLKTLKLKRNGGASARDALEELIEDDGNGAEDEDLAIDPHERALIRNILGLRDITAEDVMVPRADITGVAIDTGFDALVTDMVKDSHSRVPVYRETLDDVVGMIHMKDVLAHVHEGKDVPLSSLLREVLFVSPSIRAMDLLQEMRLTRRHLALVVDEFGGVDGLITIEDLVEEIVGDIVDEHDVEEGPKIAMVGPDTAVADARAEIEEFEALFGNVLNDEEREEVDTLGGLVFSLAGRVAARGELLTHPAGLEFEVLESDSRRIKRIRIRRVSTDELETESHP
ncbi:hemolysin family protein [uncultured Nisaea sp.]|mgnify:FL=1|jgi:hemolysin (HlyC) family protein|uniref:hemolysin family protein n=1 Tax=uncultured Nisaea sp. TaxID=538215 RepID=UPI0030EE3EEF|tara:strand:- start:1035 stop:2000 length:966 start_codon:yes stop_codon:yes gene_type:complete